MARQASLVFWRVLQNIYQRITKLYKLLHFELQKDVPTSTAFKMLHKTYHLSAHQLIVQ